MTLWTASEATAATGGQATTDWTACGVSIDTRTLLKGDLFVALQAARDGHDFVAQALAKGAAAALVSRIPQDVPPDAPLLIVEDVLPALEALARAARAGLMGEPATQGAMGEARLLSRLAPDDRAARAWAKLQQDLTDRSRHGRAVNLDPASLILDMIFKIEESAQGVAAA